MGKPGPMWGPPVISWFIKTINYKYHKPLVIEVINRQYDECSTCMLVYRRVTRGRFGWASKRWVAILRGHQNEIQNIIIPLWGKYDLYIYKDIHTM